MIVGNHAGNSNDYISGVLLLYDPYTERLPGARDRLFIVTRR